MKKYLLYLIFVFSFLYMIIPLNLNIYHTNTHLGESQSLKTNSIHTSNITIISDGYNNTYWNEGQSETPDIAIDSSGIIHTVWQDGTNGIWGGGLDDEIMYAFYNESVGWSNITVISDGYNGSYWNNRTSANPKIAVDHSGVIHVVWQDLTTIQWENTNQIFYASYDESVGWSNATMISDGYNGTYWNDEANIGPSIAIDNSGDLHVVWEGHKFDYWGNDIEIMYVSYNELVGWSNITIVSDDGTLWNDDHSQGPKIAADPSGNIHVVWFDDTDGPWGSDKEIMYAFYNESIGWSNATVISDGFNSFYWNNDSSSDANILIDSLGILHVVWEDMSDGPWGTDWEIMYAFYNESIGWSNVTIISDDETGWNDGLSFDSDIYIDINDNIYVVWQDTTMGYWKNNPTDSEIMFVSHMHETGWSNITVISDGFNNIYWNTDESESPSIIVDSSGTIHVIWREYTNGPWTDNMFDTEIMHVLILFQADLSINPLFYMNTSLSIFFLGIIAYLLFIEDNKKKRTLETTFSKKKTLINTVKISLAFSVSVLQISQIDYNSKTYTPVTTKNILLHIFPVILLVISLLILLLLIVSVISTIEEYKTHLKSKRIEVRASHRIDFDQIFQNDNRQKIIRKVLHSPSIHFNELLRECNLTRGQLQWHLKILLEFGIIKKEKIGQYITFKPLSNDLDSNMFKKKIAKSETSLEILKMINNSPGIIQSKIAQNLGLKRSTINYHIKKLENINLIRLDKKARDINLYPLV